MVLLKKGLNMILISDLGITIFVGLIIIFILGAFLFVRNLFYNGFNWESIFFIFPLIFLIVAIIAYAVKLFS